MDSSSTSAQKPFTFPVMKKAIEDLFTKPSITKDDIEHFQDRYWEQLVPNFSQALKLLDIHNVPRHNILWSINDRLLDAIKTNVEVKSESEDKRKCQKLWQKLLKTGMVYIHHPYMRPLIMQVLGKMNSIKERHAKLIVDNPYLYADAPLPVLRHIWIAQPNKFREEFDKVIAQFQLSWSDALLDALSMSIASTASFTADILPLLYWPPKRRRREAAIVRMVEMIGDGQVLYDKAVQILREECLRAKENTTETFTTRRISESLTPVAKRRRHRLLSSESSADDKFPPSDIPYQLESLGSLSSSTEVNGATLSAIRFDLLMSLNEAKIERLCAPDRIHRFVWCMDACVRNRRIDQRHAIELAYHLTVQRQRVKDSDVGSSTAADHKGESEGETTQDSKRHRSKCKRKPLVDESVHDDYQGNQESVESKLLEIDIHMACQDPWVLYTVCSAIIRCTVNGMYENKLPRDIPEISLLVHLLLLGSGEAFLKEPQFKDATTQNSRNSRNDSMLTLGQLADIVICRLLPSIAQLQVSIWRAQVAEEIITHSSCMWPGGITGPPTSPGLQNPTGVRRSSTQDAREICQIPGHLQKQLSGASQSTMVSIPPDYFSHPIGFLLLQYHALFALEHHELGVLRLLLKTVAYFVQQQFHRTLRQTGSSKSTPVKYPSSPLFPTDVAQFRWRSEVLQALVLGITRLPSSTIIDGGNHLTYPHSMSSSTPNEKITSLGIGERDNEKVNMDLIKSSSGAGSSIEFGTKSSSNFGIRNPTESQSASTSIITRAELALLLKSSLTLIDDLQLLSLAQLTPLLSSCTPTLGSNLGSNEPGQLNESSTSSSSPSISERERALLMLTRHCTLSDSTDSSEALQQPLSLSSHYRSSDPRVLNALDLLRKGSDKALTHLPLTPSAGKSGFSSFFPTATSRPVTTQQNESAWVGATPSSPMSKGMRPSSFTIASSTSHRFDAKHYSYISATSYSSMPSGVCAQLPIGTPLTNPGLMGATPNYPNMGFGQSSIIPPTPRRPSTPPREFRPSSPTSSSSTNPSRAFNQPTQGFDFETTPSCPSPSVHRPTGAGANSTTFQYFRPRSPSPT